MTTVFFMQLFNLEVESAIRSDDIIIEDIEVGYGSKSWAWNVGERVEV